MVQGDAILEMAVLSAGCRYSGNSVVKFELSKPQPPNLSLHISIVGEKRCLQGPGYSPSMRCQVRVTDHLRHCFVAGE
jgi:hypothetical protein